MTDLEIKRKELELVKVAAARAELEFKILEKLDEIERIKHNIDAQIKREVELKEELLKVTKK